MSGLSLKELANTCRAIGVLAQHMYMADPRLMFNCYQSVNAHLERALAGENADLICEELAKHLETHFPEVAEAITLLSRGAAPESEG